MTQDKQYAVGIDLGGTKILAAIVDQDGDIHSQGKIATQPQDGDQAVIRRIGDLVQDVWEQSGIGTDRICGIGIATAGIIDTVRQKVIYASNLNWNDVRIGDRMNERFGVPVELINDANAAAVAERTFGNARGTDDLIYVTVSTGVGAGIICGGRLITGVGDSAGEFGHISIHPEGPFCACGNRGCLENYVSGLALAKKAQALLKAGAESSLSAVGGGERDAITARDIGEAAENGDKLSIELLTQAGYFLGIGLTNLIHLFNPQVLVFGGGVIKNGRLLVEAAEQVIRERCISRMAKQASIQISTMEDTAGVLGAAGMFFQAERKKLAI
ncbi:ROK family protein [Brevibacillus borstelensis]|uniref:ROK family protein n=1 Tax=Brevibacillus borstelensis TaxID=45462 RepID=UPI0030BAFDD7